MKNLKKDKVLNFLNQSKKKIVKRKNGALNETNTNTTNEINSNIMSRKAGESGRIDDLKVEPLDVNDIISASKKNIPSSSPSSVPDELHESIKSIYQIESILNENTEIHKEIFFKNLNLDSIHAPDEISRQENEDESYSQDQDESYSKDILKEFKGHDKIDSSNNREDGLSKNCDLNSIKITNGRGIDDFHHNSNSNNEDNDEDIDEDNDIDTSELLASTNSSRNQDSNSVKEKEDWEISNSLIQKHIVDRSNEKVQINDGTNADEYSMSFESNTDLKDQQFPKEGLTDTISQFESKKGIESFDDSISSISMDDRPSESFLKHDEDIIDDITHQVAALKSTADLIPGKLISIPLF